MAFKQYSNLAEVLLANNVSYQKSVFTSTYPLAVPPSLQEDITFTLYEVAYNVSEAAICENLIYPILKSVWRNYTNEFSLWSHYSLKVNDELLGIPDYIFSKRSDKGQIFFESPFVAVVEAKKDNFTEGWSQCALEMITLQKLNQNPAQEIYGIVSNGDVWEFANLQKDVFTTYLNKCQITDLTDLYGFLNTILQHIKQQLLTY